MVESSWDEQYTDLIQRAAVIIRSYSSHNIVYQPLREAQKASTDHSSIRRAPLPSNAGAAQLPVSRAARSMLLRDAAVLGAGPVPGRGGSAAAGLRQHGAVRGAAGRVALPQPGAERRGPGLVGNKSYNELIERLVDYRGVLMTEEANEKAAMETEKRVDTESSSDTTPTEEEEVKPAAASLPSPLTTQTAGFQNLSIDINSAPASSTGAAGSPNSTTSMTSPKKSPSQQTVRTMMKERHISDADALDTATTLLEEGPVLEEFFNTTASQLTYYGLVKLHEGLRERQLCVFFRNNHFSTLFKVRTTRKHRVTKPISNAVAVTDAGYLDEPSVVWELLNEIDGDTEYLDAHFRPVTSSEQQESILTQQKQQREQDQLEEEQQLRKARALSLSGSMSPGDASKQTTGSDSRAPEHSMPSDGLFGESAETSEENLDPDYLLALKFQREEEERVRGSKRVPPRISPRHMQPVGADCDTTEQAGDGYEGETEDDDADGDRMRNESSGQDEDHIHETSESEFIPVSADGEMLISEEELEAQRQAERYYQEQKRQVDAQTRQYQQEEDRLRQQQLQQQQQLRSGQRRRPSEGSDCTIS
ncbi:hypothetical protein ON010_g8248 [Phytophthora cinnamomi]|nr:hypothetical protein ON010_g8248 [Phytophthora cinnamomi]